MAATATNRKQKPLKEDKKEGQVRDESAVLRAETVIPNQNAATSSRPNCYG